MQNSRTTTVYFLLAAGWLIIAGWQSLEHVRFRDSSRAALRDRAKEIGRTLGVVIRSERRFGRVQKDRLEAALSELASTNTLRAVMLVSPQFDVVAQAGKPVNLNQKMLEELSREEVRWDNGIASVFDVVALGANAQNDPTTTTIVLTPEEEQRSPFGRRPPPPRRDDGDTSGRQHDDQARTGRDFTPFGPPPPSELLTTESLAASRPAHFDSGSTLSLAGARGGRGGPRGGEGDRFGRGGGRGGFRGLAWMSPDQYRELEEKRGLYGFAVQMPMASYEAAIHYDLWIRFTTLAIALLAVGGMGFAWRNTERINRMQLRLLKASEMNVHLQELNIASAGLAHETRNPLNIVRGLAQLISQRPDISDEIHQKAGEITVEVDRITGRLNEFINYSRSPVPRPTPTNLVAVIADVKRALEMDLSDKSIEVEIKGPPLVVEADESLLRQVYFNLLLNATQFLGQGGHVNVQIQTTGQREAAFVILDDGPGVPREYQKEIFKPYFTTRPGGTGLGLAVVRQIVLAHHWEIEYVASESGGAGFRVSGLKVI